MENIKRTSVTSLLRGSRRGSRTGIGFRKVEGERHRGERHVLVAIYLSDEQRNIDARSHHNEDYLAR